MSVAKDWEKHQTSTITVEEKLTIAINENFKLKERIAELSQIIFNQSALIEILRKQEEIRIVLEEINKED